MAETRKVSKEAVYTHGHHPSVLRSHSWRTATNSCAFLLPLLRPTLKILDIGCGPGTITADLAALVPEGSVIGLEYAPEVLIQARKLSEERGLNNLTFEEGDVMKLRFKDGEFDVVHAHQVLQHVGDPVGALREMRRVCKKGGIVAVRDADFSSFTWYPNIGGLDEWSNLYKRVARSNGGEPDAGRRLHVWAVEAGFDRSQLTCSASTWCYATPSERSWWSGLWAERTVSSAFAALAVGGGHASEEQLKEVAASWTHWGTQEDGWIMVPSGELICRV
jgi:SAM-dependent methyltransferase